MKKLIAMLLCAAMLLAVAAGCANGSDEPATDDPAAADAAENALQAEPGPTENENITERGCIIDFENAFYAFAPETVMMTTTGGLTITWEELFFGLYVSISQALDFMGEITDWNEFLDEGYTIAETVLNMARDHILWFKAVEYGAALHNVSLSPDNLEALREQKDFLIDMYGGLEGLMEFLWFDSGIRSFELFENVLTATHLMGSIREHIFGPESMLLTDEQAEEFFAERDDGFMMAKHILITSGDDPAGARERADEIWERLIEYEGDDIERYFDELMFEYSEDPGLAHAPQGYLFQYFDMVPEFSQATSELEIGQFSQPVESVHGFHIIFRVPLDLDDIPFSFMNMGHFETLRSFAASGLFFDMMDDWFDGLLPNYTEAFNSIVLPEIFMPC